MIVDPAAEIKRYRLLGVTKSDDGAIALLSDGANTVSLKENERLAGFAAIAIGPRDITFQKGDVVASLTLPDSSGAQ